MLFVSLALASCAQDAGPPSARTHPTIVSLNPCTDAILAEVADPGQLLALSHYSADPASSSMDVAAARRIGVTSGTAEEVLALAPDIVVASSFMDPASRRAFERLGIQVESVGIASTVAESEAQVRRLAALAGHPGRGEALVARIEAALTEARPPDAARPVALVWQEGGLVAGPGSLVTELLERSGFAGLAATRALGQGAYLPLEEVLADPPDVVLAAGGERMLTHPALRRLSDMKYAAIDPALLFCGGPTIPKLAARFREVRRGLTP